MSGLLYGIALQWRLDIRSRALLITCYVVPLLFFALMGGIFSSTNPESKETLIQGMSIMGVSMGALIGLPPSLAEVYGKETRNLYQANGIPVSFMLVSTGISTFIHLLIMSTLIYVLAPVLFDAEVPSEPWMYFAALALFILASICVGSALGVVAKTQAKLTMLSQIIFLPSIMLTGILFPAAMLPQFLQMMGSLFPAAWGYALMQNGGFCLGNLCPLVGIAALAILFCAFWIRQQRKES